MISAEQVQRMMNEAVQKAKEEQMEMLKQQQEELREQREAMKEQNRKFTEILEAIKKKEDDTQADRAAREEIDASLDERLADYNNRRKKAYRERGYLPPQDLSPAAWI